MEQNKEYTIEDVVFGRQSIDLCSDEKGKNSKRERAYAAINDYDAQRRV